MPRPSIPPAVVAMAFPVSLLRSATLSSEREGATDNSGVVAACVASALEGTVRVWVAIWGWTAPVTLRFISGSSVCR